MSDLFNSGGSVSCPISNPILSLIFTSGNYRDLDIYAATQYAAVCRGWRHAVSEIRRLFISDRYSVSLLRTSRGLATFLRLFRPSPNLVLIFNENIGIPDYRALRSALDYAGYTVVNSWDAGDSSPAAASFAILPVHPSFSRENLYKYDEIHRPPRSLFDHQMTIPDYCISSPCERLWRCAGRQTKYLNIDRLIYCDWHGERRVANLRQLEYEISGFVLTILSRRPMRKIDVVITVASPCKGELSHPLKRDEKVHQLRLLIVSLAARLLESLDLKQELGAWHFKPFTDLFAEKYLESHAFIKLSGGRRVHVTLVFEPSWTDPEPC